MVSRCSQGGFRVVSEGFQGVSVHVKAFQDVSGAIRGFWKAFNEASVSFKRGFEEFQGVLGDFRMF